VVEFERSLTAFRMTLEDDTRLGRKKNSDSIKFLLSAHLYNSLVDVIPNAVWDLQKSKMSTSQSETLEFGK